jgi:hypothetical protein
VDHLVNPLAEVNPEAIYDLLFTTANQVLKTFARQYLGGEVGVTAVLHTLRQVQGRLWGQTLQHHIHLHCMVTAGALVQTKQGYRWRKSQKGFLVPVVALAQQFRDLFCQGVQRLQRQGELRLVGPCADLNVAARVPAMRAKQWEDIEGHRAEGCGSTARRTTTRC